MKKIFTLFAILFISLGAFAQDEELAQFPRAFEKIKAARAAYITQRLNLTSDEAEKFWPVYNEYSQKRLDLKLEYHRAKKSGIDEKELLDLDLKIKQQELDLEKDYSDRLLKVISPQKLVLLRQAETDFRKLLLRQVQQRRQNGRKERLLDR